MVNARTGGSEGVQLLIWGCKAIINHEGRSVGSAPGSKMIGNRALAAVVDGAPVARTLSKCTATAGRQRGRLSERPGRIRFSVST